jgi:PhnB protein
MQLISYLTFNGQCEEAFRFYEQSLGGQIESMMPHSGSPMENHVPAEWKDKIMHARLTVGGATLMGSDAPPDRYEAPKGSWVHIGLEDAAEADRIFQILSEGGSINMPIQKTFWASRFGMLVDRFGTPWMVNCA